MSLKPICFALATAGLVGAGPAVLHAEATAPKSAVNLDLGAGLAPEDAPRIAPLSLAHQMAALGQLQGDALILLAAARLAALVQITPGEGLKMTSSGEARSFEDADLAPVSRPMDAAAMFALASDLASGDPLLLELIADAQAEQPQGRIGTAISQTSSLAPGRTDSWELAFKGQTLAEVSVIGSGGSDLEMVVTDENGNVICYVGGPGDVALCDFYPAWDGVFHVAIGNQGEGQNHYQLITN